MASEIVQAIKHVCEEKGLTYETVIEAISMALAAAYRKDYGNKMQNIEVEFLPETGAIKAFDVKTVVEDISAEELAAIEAKQAELQAAREASKAYGEPANEPVDEESSAFNPKTDVMFSDARVLKSSVKLGDVIRTELPVASEFGRMAAMTAKQVIMQKLREAEREIIFNEYKEYEGEVLIGTVQRREGRIILVDLGRTTAIILPEDQVRTENYTSGQRLKVYVREVSLGVRGPQILLSRTSEELVKELFDIEIPEVGENVVQVRAVAREAGARSKVAVTSTDAAVDAVGACIGQRGTRIQTIINELSGEKIDVIEWNEKADEFIKASLAPAKVLSVVLDEAEKSAFVKVAEDQLSLAIGRGGQNVRLAAKLTGWKINVSAPAIETATAEVSEETHSADEMTEADEVAAENSVDENTAVDVTPIGQDAPGDEDTNS